MHACTPATGPGRSSLCLGSRAGAATGRRYPKPEMNGVKKSDGAIVCAGQRPDQVGSSPTGARVRGAISKSGGNSSLAGVS